jgi:hypothetical protein
MARMFFVSVPATQFVMVGNVKVTSRYHRKLLGMPGSTYRR